MLKDFFDKISYFGLLTILVNLEPWPLFEGLFKKTEQSRFDWLMKLNRSIYFKKPAVVGLENLAGISIKSPLVIVVSHFSDSDLQIVAGELRLKLKKVRPGRLLAMSCQTENFADLKTSFFIKAAGKNHFFGIDAYFDKLTGRLKFTFNSENFEKMAEALRSGTDIIIAAHEPISNIPDSRWALPARSGLGAAFLAQLSGATVLPVAVDILTMKHVGMSADIAGTAARLLKGERPNVKIVIGKALKFDKIDRKELDMLEPYLKRKNCPQDMMSQEQQVLGKKVLGKIIDYGDEIMRSIAMLLPKEKRGGW